MPISGYIQVDKTAAKLFHAAVINMDPSLINDGKQDLHNSSKIVFGVLGSKRDPRLAEKIQEFAICG